MTETRRAWAAALVLGLAGFGLNLLPVPLTQVELQPGFGLFFGSVPALLAAAAYGPGPGALAGAVAASRTVAVWGHPYGLVLLTLEAAAVGLLRRRIRPIFAVLIFWLVGGAPLGAVSFIAALGVEALVTTVVLLKLLLNGMLAALIAEAMLLSLAIRRWLGITERPRVRQYLGVLVALAAAVPLLAFGIYDARRQWSAAAEGVTGGAEVAVRAWSGGLARGVTEHRERLLTLAAALEAEAQAAPQAETEPESDPEAGPLALRDPQPAPGFYLLSHAELVEGRRVPWRDLVSVRDPEAGDVVPFRAALAGAPGGEVATSEPVVARGRGPLIVLGTALSPSADAEERHYLITAVDVAPLFGTVPTRWPEGQVRVASGGGVLLFDGRAVADTLVLVTDNPGYRAALGAAPPRAGLGAGADPLVLAAATVDGPGWIVWAEIPSDRLLGGLLSTLLTVELILLGSLLAALALGFAIGRRIEQPLTRLARATRRLAMRDFSVRADRRLMEAAPAELALLGASLNATAARLERSRRETERALREAQEAGITRERFFAAAAHELRTPMNAITGYVDVLALGAHGEMNPEQREAVERIRWSATHLLELLNDLLDLSRIAAGKVEVEPETVLVRDIIEDVAAAVRIAAAEKGLQLVIEPGEPERAVLDPLRVKQILLNLAANAVKFTDEGSVTLRWGMAPPAGDEPAACLYFAVTDTGPGIPPELQEHVFEEFHQTDLGRARRGTGLGLAISRRLARLLGGDIVLQSRPGAGSTFTLWLPPPGAARSQTRASDAPRPAPAWPSGR